MFVFLRCTNLEREPLRLFDPVNDLLLSDHSYLTWRKFGQALPGGAAAFAFVGFDGKGLGIFFDKSSAIERLWVDRLISDELYIEESDGGDPDLYQHSKFYRLFEQPTNWRECELKLNLFNEFVKDKRREGILIPPGSGVRFCNLWREFVIPQLVAKLLPIYRAKFGL